METPELKTIKKQLPQGAMTEIGKRVGLSRFVVSNFFRGDYHTHKDIEILEVAAEIIAARKKKKNEVMAALNEALKA